MRPLLQGKGRLGTLGARCKEAGELRRAQAPSSSPGRARSHPELRSSLRTAGGAQGCSASKDTWTPEEPGLSHLVGERSARGSRLGQVGAMGSAGWLSLPAYPGTMPPNRLLPKQVLVASHLPTHYPSIHLPVHPFICLPEDPLCVWQPIATLLTCLESCFLRPFPSHPCHTTPRPNPCPTHLPHSGCDLSPSPDPLRSPPWARKRGHYLEQE